jgi:hypothetical protein
VCSCNPNYTGGRDQEDLRLRSAGQTVNETPSQQTRKAGWFMPVVPATKKAGVLQSKASLRKNVRCY